MLAAIKTSAITLPASQTWYHRSTFRYPVVSRKGVNAYRDQGVELVNLLEIIDVRELGSGVVINL
jgi:hypothetical protein